MKRDESKRKATALAFDPLDPAPRVTASGQGAFADLIVETARRHGREVVVDPELADLLGHLPVGPAIPGPLFRSVATVFALVYNLRQEAARQAGANRG